MIRACRACDERRPRNKDGITRLKRFRKLGSHPRVIVSLRVRFGWVRIGWLGTREERRGEERLAGLRDLADRLLFFLLFSWFTFKTQRSFRPELDPLPMCMRFCYSVGGSTCLTLPLGSSACCHLGFNGVPFALNASDHRRILSFDAGKP